MKELLERVLSTLTARIRLLESRLSVKSQIPFQRVPQETFRLPDLNWSENRLRTVSVAENKEWVIHNPDRGGDAPNQRTVQVITRFDGNFQICFYENSGDPDHPYISIGVRELNTRIQNLIENWMLGILTPRELCDQFDDFEDIGP